MCVEGRGYWKPGMLKSILFIVAQDTKRFNSPMLPMQNTNANGDAALVTFF